MSCESNTRSCSRKCGAYSEFKNPDETANKILTESYPRLVEILDGHPSLPKVNDLTLDHLLANYTYSTQVVAGKNYKFHIVHSDTKYELIVYHKLDGSVHVTSFSKLD